MPVPTLQSVYRALKRGSLDRVYYLTGEEALLKDDLARAIVDAAVDPASRDFNVDMRNAGDLDGEALHALVETPPMLAERRAIVVRGLEQWRRNAKVWEVLHRYLSNPSPSTVLVLIHGSGERPNTDVAKATTHVAVGIPTPTQRLRWVSKQAKQRGFTLSDAAAEHLLASVGGGDLAALAMELDKLAAAAGAREVDAAEVAAFVGVRHGETLQDWVDLVLGGETLRALNLIDSVLAQAGISGVRMLMALGTGLVGARLARARADEGLAGAPLERAVMGSLRTARPPQIRGWQTEAAKWSAAAQRWTGRELDEALRAAYAADRDLKSTTVSDERGILATLLLRMARRAA